MEASEMGVRRGKLGRIAGLKAPITHVGMSGAVGNDWKAKEAARAASAAALRASFPHLVPISPKVDALQAAAKNIRIELKSAFPKVKFSVKSSRFSMGDSIDVSWIDGPISEQVEAIISRYQAGSFNGMEDIYEHSRSAWKDAFGDAKYVHARRDDSDAALVSAIRTVRAKYAANLAARGIEEIGIADLRAGRLYQVLVIDGACMSDCNLQSLIRREAARRTWAIARVAQVQAVEEVAA